MDEYTVLLRGLAGVSIVGFVGYTIKSISSLQTQIRELELRIAERYATIAVTTEIRNDLKSVLAVVYEIAGKLGVPVRRD